MLRAGVLFVRAQAISLMPERNLRLGKERAEGMPHACSLRCFTRLAPRSSTRARCDAKRLNN